MSDYERLEESAGGPATEGGRGDEVAEPERSRRAAGGGFAPRGTRSRVARTISPVAKRGTEFTGEQRLLVLDCWFRSELAATDFAPLVGISTASLYAWRRKFEDEGPAGLLGHKRGMRGSQLPEPTKRAILMMKEAHPDWGQDRIHDMLIRTQGLEASGGAVQRVLKEAGYEVVEATTRPNPPKAKRFERTRPNELWQTDLFSFVLKRERRRVHLVAYLDDFSRFVVGFGLHASASGAMVRETFEEAIANFGAPGEILTRQRRAVCDVARQECVCEVVLEARHQADRGASASAADAGQDRALLGDAAPGADRRRDLPRHGGREAAHRALRRLLQLPAHASGHRRPGSGGPLLRGL